MDNFRLRGMVPYESFIQSGCALCVCVCVCTCVCVCERDAACVFVLLVFGRVRAILKSSMTDPSHLGGKEKGNRERRKNLTPVAGLNLPGKKPLFMELFLGLLLSEFRFMCSFLGAMEWIHTSGCALCVCMCMCVLVFLCVTLRVFLFLLFSGMGGTVLKSSVTDPSAQWGKEIGNRNKRKRRNNLRRKEKGDSESSHY